MDGRSLLASGGWDGTVRVWDPATGTPVGGPLAGHTDWVLAVAAFTGGGGRPLLASGSNDGSVRVWDPATGAELLRLVTGGPVFSTPRPATPG